MKNHVKVNIAQERPWKKSALWDCFDVFKKDETKDKNITVCNICKTQVKYMTGSTASMTAHILRRHGITLSKI